jgi:hypothetical protein
MKRFGNFFLLLSIFIFLQSCSTKPSRFERLDASVTGVDFNNEVLEKDSFNIMQNEYMYNGGGVGMADLNNDGKTDLILTGNKVSSRIYLNKGDFKFQDITDRFEGLSNSQWISGVSAVDINADGWVDLYFTSTNSKVLTERKNQLWINQGVDGSGLPSFSNKADAYGVAESGFSVHATFFDYDLDGDLDLYVLNNITNKEIPTNYRDIIKDGTAINNDRLYNNQGNGTFKDVTVEAGIVYEGFGLGLAVGDVNKDGYPDMYISNDYNSNDILYINQKNGTFKNNTRSLLSYQSKFSMGNDMADFNNDGLLDIMTTDMMPEAYFRKKQTINGNSYYVYVYNEKYGYETQYVRNMLHVHTGFSGQEMNPYSEVGQMYGMYQTEWSWSPLFADFDKDGDKDLFVTNGFPKDLTDKDFTNYKAQVYGHLIGDYDIIPRIPIVKVSNYAYENTGEAPLKNRTKDWGLDIPSFSNGAAFADLDNDGDLDYVTNNINDPAFIYRNNTIGSLQENPAFLRIALKGKSPNTLAIGAKVTLWSGGKKQYQEQFLNRGYISSVDPVVHFGLGGDLKADSVEIIWPGHTSITRLYDVKANQLLTVNEEEAQPFTASSPLTASNETIFEEETGVLDYTHKQSDYIDFFQYQAVLPHKFSQIGPFLASGDLNGDGQDDILIAGSDEEPPTFFQFTNGKYKSASLKGLDSAFTCQQAGLLIADLDNDGDNDVVSISGGYTNRDLQAYQHYVFRNEGGRFVREFLPVGPFSASVVRSCDIDKDGDLDLFIGARVAIGNFPLSPHSVILINEKGVFTKEKAIYLPMGMVTDAVFGDFDNDGLEDLVVSREWNTLLYIKNQGGGKMALQHDKFKGYSGIWYGLSAGDFDNDGQLDLIAGNLGDNHRFTLDDTYPMRLYAIDIDKNDQIDPLIAACWKDKEGNMQEYPVNYLDELASQSPFFRKKFTSYTQFSYSTMDSIFENITIDKDTMPIVNTTSSYILWNDGKGGFSWDKLPQAVQVAPLRAFVYEDMNEDGVKELWVGGNDHAYDASTGYYDSNRGSLLVYEGNRKFSVRGPEMLGFAIKGQVGSSLWLGGPQKRLVVSVNRGKLRTLRLKSSQMVQ